MKRIKDIPVITKRSDIQENDEFPIKRYSYSALTTFCSNPILFKIRYINREKIDTLTSISAVIGQAFHAALAAYFEKNENDVENGLCAGNNLIDEYHEGFIEYNNTIPNKQKAQDLFTFAYNSYINEKGKNSKEKVLGCEVYVESDIDVEWNGHKINLPIGLNGYIDIVVRNGKKLKIKDYKVVNSFSDPDKIDGRKMIQAVQYYFLAYAQYGEPPYSIIFEEVKRTKNRDNSNQVREYEIIYDQQPLFFDLYFRVYDDVTRAVNGEMVWTPNIDTMFDNEISLISYIHKLDVSEEAAKLMEQNKVKNITELLRQQIQSTANMRNLIKTSDKNYIIGRSIEYDKMKTEEKIKLKLMEHGVSVNFHSVCEGCSIDLYRFMPSIGVKMSRLLSYAQDIEQVVGVTGVRILAPIPNSNLIGFEIPKKERAFPELVQQTSSIRSLAIGVDTMNDVFRFDITKAPHLLVSGTTGSGKSVFISSLIQQIVGADESNVEIHLYDPKMVELSAFQGSDKVVEYLDDHKDIAISLAYLVDEMNARYKKLSAQKARSVAEYTGKDMPIKFVFIDEYADLITAGGKDIQSNILLLAQKSRAAGIHLIVATQRPSVDIITGLIKANFPTKVAFRVAKEIDSRVLLDCGGAEKLLGLGDMLFSGDNGLIRLQGFNLKEVK